MDDHTDDPAYEFVRAVAERFGLNPDEADMREIAEGFTAMLLPIWGIEGLRRLLAPSYLDNLDPDLLG